MHVRIIMWRIQLIDDYKAGGVVFSGAGMVA